MPMLNSLVPLSKVTLARLLQFWKATVPMLVTDEGMDIDSRLLHSLKALEPMVVIFDGMVTDVSFEQKLSIDSLMASSDEGSSIEVSPVPESAPLSMVVTDEGRVSEVRLEQP